MVDLQGFSEDVVEKVSRLCRLLSDIRIHPFLGPRLVLKGGTALNLFYLAAPRLSVDADLNYIGAADAATMTMERLAILAGLRTVAQGQGYRVTMGGDTHALSSCFLAYRSARGVLDSLKLEVNYMYRVPLGEPEEKKTRVAFEAPIRFRLVSFAELLGGKLVALLDRTAPRDLYDTAMLAEVVDVDDLFMRRVFVAMAGILPRALWEYSATRIERIENRDIETHLYPVLAATDRPMREEMLAKVLPWLERWLTLEAGERTFHERLNAGVVDGNLLFPQDPAMAGAVDHHPGLQWKALNAAKKPH